MVAVRLPRAIPIKLPQAPEEYDKADQDRTRRLIETLLSSAGLSVSSLGQIISPATVPKDWVPQSPIIGSIMGDGGTSAGAIFQLLNPINSGKNVVVYECRRLKQAAAVLDHWRITSQPFLPFTPSTGLLIHMDENDVSTITSVLTAGTGGPTALAPFPTTQAQWVAQLPAPPQAPGHYREWPIVDQMDAPIILKPGMAIECCSSTTGTGNVTGMRVVFDEIPLVKPLPSVTLIQSTRPIDSIMGAVVTTGTGNLAMVQLLNPTYSPKRLRITGMQIFGDVNNTRMRARRTREPLHMSANLVTGVTKHVNAYSSSPIYGIVQGTTQPSEGTGAMWADTDSFWYDKSGAISSFGFPLALVNRKSFPIFLNPGSAIEFEAGDASTVMYGIFLWDEVT